ncbi:hypothetical protein FGB62_380g09 [Gracilaria domingensis]|nr:hypothetical protein FGB62_380g09 [Gracilaria domingensis]
MRKRCYFIDQSSRIDELHTCELSSPDEICRVFRGGVNISVAEVIVEEILAAVCRINMRGRCSQGRQTDAVNGGCDLLAGPMLDTRGVGKSVVGRSQSAAREPERSGECAHQGVYRGA